MTILTTAVPDITITGNGALVPDEAAILNGVLSDLNAAFGGKLNLDLSTPQGQLATSFAAILASNLNAQATLINQFNPDLASGVFQDAINRIYFLERSAGKGTAVACEVSGLVGTVIPAGTIAQDEAGYKYALTSAVTIPASGVTSAIFQNTEKGAIPCPANTLNQIFSAIVGWSSVNNSTAGVLGEDVESRTAFEARRKESVAINSTNTTESMRAKIMAIDNVLDAYVYDNDSSEVKYIGATNFPVNPHSYYICIFGGSSEDIIKTIYLQKNPGCGFTGNTEGIYEDKVNYQPPYPQYQIKWQTPTPLNIYFWVKIQNNPNLPSNVTDLIKSSIRKTFNGDDGNAPARIGTDIYAGRYNRGVDDIDIYNMNILSLQVSIDDTTYSSSVGVGVEQIPILDDANIKVELI